jgi:hypothetical protein
MNQYNDFHYKYHFTKDNQKTKKITRKINDHLQQKNIFL